MVAENMLVHHHLHYYMHDNMSTRVEKNAQNTLLATFTVSDDVPSVVTPKQRTPGPITQIQCIHRCTIGNGIAYIVHVGKLSIHIHMRCTYLTNTAEFQEIPTLIHSNKKRADHE